MAGMADRANRCCIHASGIQMILLAMENDERRARDEAKEAVQKIRWRRNCLGLPSLKRGADRGKPPTSCAGLVCQMPLWRKHADEALIHLATELPL